VKGLSYHPRVAGLTIAALALVAWRAGATVLTFHIAGAGQGSAIPQSYGDRVTAATMGSHSYGAAGGFTPNVVADYIGKGSQQDLNFWATGYNQLVTSSSTSPMGLRDTR
jgi:hypothetical protein